MIVRLSGYIFIMYHILNHLSSARGQNLWIGQKLISGMNCLSPSAKALCAHSGITALPWQWRPLHVAAAADPDIGCGLLPPFPNHSFRMMNQKTAFIDKLRPEDMQSSGLFFIRIVRWMILRVRQPLSAFPRFLLRQACRACSIPADFCGYAQAPRRACSP